MSAGRYRAGVLAAGALALVVGWAVTSSVPVALVGAVTATMVPRGVVRRRRERILAERVAAWPEALRDVLSSLTVDATLHQALVRLGRSGPAPLRAVWVTYSRNAAVLSVPAALAQVRGELADPVSDHVIEALEAAHERGSTVAVAVLESLAKQVASDVQLREEMITSQAEIRAQAAVAVVLPFAMLAFLVSMNGAYARFYARPDGWVVIAVGAGLAVLGWRLISSLGRIPPDPRVLAPRGDPR